MGSEMCIRDSSKIADFLADSAKVAKVVYPGRADHPQADIIARQMSGGSTLVAFELKGGKEAAFKLQNALEIVKISNNLGDAKASSPIPAPRRTRTLQTRHGRNSVSPAALCAFPAASRIRTICWRI